MHIRHHDGIGGCKSALLREGAVKIWLSTLDRTRGSTSASVIPSLVEEDLDLRGRCEANAEHGDDKGKFT